jgi:hypothetical protein
MNMQKNKPLPSAVINPFSDKFLDEWELWKLYKKESFDFSYKGVISEQMAIKHLVDLSDGEEEKAIKIIHQSCRRQWQGFFPLKETTHGTKQSNPKTAKPTGSLRERVQQAVNKKFGGGKDTGSEPHLKAV